MMVVIRNEAIGDFPAIEAVAEDEMDAIAMYATLYNANGVAHIEKDKSGKLTITNAKGGVVCTTLLSTMGWTCFAQLARHMREVHDAHLYMSLE